LRSAGEVPVEDCYNPFMDDVHFIAEKRIRAAQEEGQFDNRQKASP